MRSALVFAVCILIGMFTAIANATTLTYISDLISTSAPSVSATHTVQFTLEDPVPPSGRIVITPESGHFGIPAGFDYTDVDLAVSTGGPYTDRPLDATADAVSDGVSVVSGISGSITIILNSTTGLSGGDQIQVRLGTNATFGTTGNENIVNPAGITSYAIRVETRDNLNVLIDVGATMIAVVAPVTLTASQPIVEPTRFNGLPSGLIAAGNPLIELSLETNLPAACRYSTVANTDYDSMTVQFNSALQGRLFYVNVGGHVNDTTYTYYVRCRALGGGTNVTDYPISFTLKPDPISNTSIETEGTVTSGPTGDLGRGGTGEFTNGSNVLYLASVLFSGSTVPNSRVTILKDGFKAANVTAAASGHFETTITGLERGAYGFQIYTQDGAGLLSALYATTLTVSQGTQNEITDITLPPTIRLSSVNADVGEKIEAMGSASPNAQIEVRVVGLAGVATLPGPRTIYATSTESGAWSATIDAKGYVQGVYAVQARVSISEQVKSGYSKQINLTVGQSNQSGACGKPDMNGDEKVNLVDFSIFLLHWQTDHAEADYTCDTLVNLADFSVLLFNWTG